MLKSLATFIPPPRTGFARLAVAGFVLCAVCQSFAADILWKSDLSGRSPGPAEDFGTDAVILEEEGQRILSKRNTKSEVFFAYETKEASELIDYRSQVRFRFSDQCSMIIAVKNRGKDRVDADYLWYYVAVNRNELSVSIHHLKDRESLATDPRLGGKIVFKDVGFPNLSPDSWITFSVDVGEKVLKVRLSQNSGESGEWEFPVFSGTGGSRIVARVPVDIGEFVIEKLPQPVKPAE